RDSPASSAIAANRSRSAGKVAPSVLANVPDTQAWFDGYDGWFGRPIGVVIAGSACQGRISQYVYFASWQAMLASMAAMFDNASACAARRSSRRYCTTRSDACSFQKPAASEAVVAAQYCAIASCAGVRVSESWRISARAARNSADPNAGGGGGRN